MDFQELRVKDIHSVSRYIPTSKHWCAKNRKNHIVGIQLNGSALHTFDFGHFTMQENSLFFLNQKDNYTVDIFEKGEAFSIHFTTCEEIDTDSFCVPTTNATVALSILQKAEIAKAVNHHFKLYSLLYQFCGEVEYVRNKAYYPKDSRILEAREYMDLHFREQDCLSKAVSQSHLSARRFGELFRNIYGCTPNRYIVSKKVDYAKALLSLGNVSVTEVANLCNFSDVYYFSKVFKNETGIMPSKWNP